MTKLVLDIDSANNCSFVIRNLALARVILIQSVDECGDKIIQVAIVLLVVSEIAQLAFVYEGCV